MKQTTQPHQMLRLRMSGTISLLPPYDFMAFTCSLYLTDVYLGFIWFFVFIFEYLSVVHADPVFRRNCINSD
jgi:hypothetical protein